MKDNRMTWEEFIDKALPNNKRWVHNADECVNIRPGYTDGEFLHYPIGNTTMDKHILVASGTGAGKESFLNSMVMSLCTEYSHKELELWLCGNNGTEFSDFKDNKDFYHITHMCSSSDIEAFANLIQELNTIAVGRYKTVKDFGEKTVVQFNQHWRGEYKRTNNPTFLANCFKRIVLVIDDSKQLEFLEDDNIYHNLLEIIKMGSATNINIVIATGSVQEFSKEDFMCQFTLKFVLRTTEECSEFLLGDYQAVDLAKYGELIAYNTRDIHSKPCTIKTTFPIIDADMIDKYISKLT